MLGSEMKLVSSQFDKNDKSVQAASAFTIALNITNFNNYSSEDIRQLTNEVMETANQFAQRKGVVFA